jgi:hypothetical protein
VSYFIVVHLVNLWHHPTPVISKLPSEVARNANWALPQAFWTRNPKT